MSLASGDKKQKTTRPRKRKNMDEDYIDLTDESFNLPYEMDFVASRTRYNEKEEEELAKALSLSEQPYSLKKQKSSCQSIIEEQNQEYASALQAEKEKEDQLLLAKVLETSKQSQLEDRRTRLEKDLKNNLPMSGKTCEIAVRLPDGTRLIGKFLEEDTLQKLRNWIEHQALQRDEKFPSNFLIAFSYPAKILENDKLTLREYGLCPKSLLNISLV